MHTTVTVFIAALVIAVLVIRPRSEGMLALHSSKFQSSGESDGYINKIPIGKRCRMIGQKRKELGLPFDISECMNRLVEKRRQNQNWQNRGGYKVMKRYRNNGRPYKRSIASRCAKFTDPTQNAECKRKLVQKRSQNPKWWNLGGYALK